MSAEIGGEKRNCCWDTWYGTDAWLGTFRSCRSLYYKGIGPSSIASWRNNWPQLSTYFKYPGEIRKLIYTTNSIENFKRQLRKVTKSKTIFPTDDSLFKILYLAMTDITKKWTGKTWDWGQTLDQLCIYFGDRIQPEDLE